MTFPIPYLEEKLNYLQMTLIYSCLLKQRMSLNLRSIHTFLHVLLIFGTVYLVDVNSVNLFKARLDRFSGSRWTKM